MFDPQSKIVYHLDTILDFIHGNNPSPILLEIDPSNTCNHGCSFCISSYIHLPESKDLETYNKDIMPRDILMSLCKDIVNMNISAVNWTGGGEPTINKHIGEAINYLGVHKVKMGMFTNGTLLDKRNIIDSIVQYFTWIRISIDSNKENYNRIRRASNSEDWNKMISNLNLLIKRKKELQSSLDIGVGFVITPNNYKDIIDFAQFFSTYDITYCQFKPEIVNRERDNGVQKTVEFWEYIHPYLTQAKEILGNKFQINDYKLYDLKNDPEFLGRTYKKCLGSQFQPCIGADSNVYVCTNHRGYKQYSYGSLKEKSFSEIWNNIVIRNQIMNQIDNIEQFCNCTKLCKPHESNKKVWEIYQNYNNENYIKTIRDIQTNLKSSWGQKLNHPDFI